MKTKLQIVLLSALACFPAACHKAEKALNSIEYDRFTVKVEKAEPRSLEEQLLIVGSIKALEEAVLYPRVGGKLLKNILKEGEPVKRDQAVALVERDEVGAVYEPAPVPSTINGVVGRIYLDAGTNVTPLTKIALIVNQSKVRVQAEVPERHVSRVFQDQTAKISVEAFPNISFNGKVYKISPVVNQENRSVPIEVLADNEKNLLKSGMFAKVTLITGRRQNAVSVSNEAVQQDEKEGAYVFLPCDGTACKRRVKTGISTMEFTEITEGLKAGERVICSGLYGLKDGSKIEIK